MTMRLENWVRIVYQAVIEQFLISTGGALCWVAKGCRESFSSELVGRETRNTLVGVTFWLIVSLPLSGSLPA